jgi:hypothetical protein
MSEMLRQGGCRCGKVRFEVTDPAMLTVACHCTGCQHMTASAYSLSEGHRMSAFKIVAGEPVIGGIHGPTRHFHCDYCKSWLYTVPQGIPDFVNVRTTMFDDPIPESPYVETYIGEGLAWARTGATRSFEKLPELDEWPELIKEYAARDAAMEEANR